MDRRSFFRRTAAVAAVAAAAPHELLSALEPVEQADLVKPCVPVACPPVEEFELNTITIFAESFEGMAIRPAMCAPLTVLYDLGMTNLDRKPIRYSLPDLITS